MNQCDRVSGSFDELGIVGDGPALGALRQQAVALGISHDVTFVGALPHSAAMDELEAADVLLYPAYDPGGMVVIEAITSCSWIRSQAP